MDDGEYETQARVCASKTRYWKLAHAEREVDRQRAVGKRYRVYACPVCSGWHLTKED